MSTPLRKGERRYPVELSAIAVRNAVAVARTRPIIGLVTNDAPEPKKVSPFAVARRPSDGKAFEGVERRRILTPPSPPPIFPEAPAEANEVTVFHELGKALTSSLQLDQVLRTIMEKINEVLRPDTWSLLLMDQERDELYFQIATGKARKR